MSELRVMYRNEIVLKKYTINAAGQPVNTSSTLMVLCLPYRKTELEATKEFERLALEEICDE